MLIEIKHRVSAAVLFSIETESWRLAVEAAVKGGAYLRGADLRGADLGGADLGGADLGGAYLRGAYLGGAYLRGADLGGADLGGAYLRGADLRGAYLRGADLGGADLGGAYLRGADLRGADLGGAYLGGADGQQLTLIGERPFLQVGPLGSRADYLLAFLTDAGVYVRAGCFWDRLDAFKAAAAATHGDAIHGREYQAAIALIEAHAQLWTPAKAESEAA